METKPAQFKPFTEQDIRNYTDSGSFSNGKAYARDGYVYDTVLRENMIQARSRGHSGGPYKVEATLALANAPGHEAITDYECSCPRGGFCKHVVAMLVVWLRQPDTFIAVTDPAILLADLTRDELATILTALLKQAPELERRVERLLPTLRPAEGGTTHATVDPNTIHRQVADLVTSRYDQWNDWNDDTDSDEELNELLELAHRYAEGGHWANAYVIYEALVKETIKSMEEYSDDESSLPEVIEAGCDGLRRILAAQAELAPTDRLSSTDRAGLIKTLYDAWIYDQDFGNLADIAPALAEAVTPGERKQLEGWLRGDMRRDSWGSKAFVRFIISLKERDGLSDEQILDEYRKAGLYDELTIKLIEQGRVDEALTVANDFLPQATQATQFAERLLALGKKWVDPALAFIEGRLAKVEEAQRAAAKQKNPQRTTEDYQHAQNHAYYSLWLEQQYSLHKRPDKALEIAQRRFELEPGERAYQSVQQAAQLAGQPKGLWAETRPLLLADLEAQDVWGALINIHLREKEPEEARAALASLEQHLTAHTPTNWSALDYVSPPALADYQLRVAQAIETTHPAEARGVYQRLAENWIAQRGRANYQQAADYLLRVRDLYTREGQQAEWLAYITDLRKRNKSLSALREELAARKIE